MDSTSASVCRLVALSVFHFSICVFARSDCMLWAVCSNCVRIPFSSLTEAYATGGGVPAGAPADSCGFAAASVSRAVNTAMRQKNDRTEINREFAIGLQLCLYVFANHILFEVVHPSRDLR